MKTCLQMGGLECVITGLMDEFKGFFTKYRIRNIVGVNPQICGSLKEESGILFKFARNNGPFICKIIKWNCSSIVILMMKESQLQIRGFDPTPNAGGRHSPLSSYSPRFSSP